MILPSSFYVDVVVHVQLNHSFLISKGFYFSSKIEKNKGDRDFKVVL